MLRRDETFSLEQLETRQLMAVSASVTAGYLAIRGTESADVIFVRQVKGRISVDGLAGSHASATIKGILVDARGGNDVVALLGPALASGTQNITKPSIISAGAGNDLVVGAESIDLIVGDAGNDTLYGFGGNDAIVGGAGNDVLVGGAGNDRMAGT
jgi:Ca2+-binding RTX toxin-like protein